MVTASSPFATACVHIIANLALSALILHPLNCTPQLAVGYADGSIRLWDLRSGECVVTLKGHKGAVSALRYNRSGALLASGSKDTDVIVWDVAGEAGLFRLRGHKDQVTDLVRGCGHDTAPMRWLSAAPTVCPLHTIVATDSSRMLCKNCVSSPPTPPTTLV